jgi:hypothetical protein
MDAGWLAGADRIVRRGRRHTRDIGSVAGRPQNSHGRAQLPQAGAIRPPIPAGTGTRGPARKVPALPGPGHGALAELASVAPGHDPGLIDASGGPRVITRRGYAWQGDYQLVPEPLLVAIDMGESTIR